MNLPSWLAGLIVVPAALAACANGQSETSAEPIPFTVIAKGQYGDITKRQFLVIDNTGQWQELWQSHSDQRSNVPAVNFDQSLVIAVFMGQQRSGGYNVDIHGIKKYDQTVWVEVVEHKPDPERMVTMALTQPYVMVRIPKHTADIRFKLISNEQ